MKIQPKKSWSNFLIDKEIIKRILNCTDIQNKDILEVGPGTGNLTNEILKNNPKKLILIEKDNHLLDLLKKIYRQYHIY